jgi:hypothetical protein
LRHDGVNVADVIGSEGVLGAFLKAIEALAVNGAQWENVGSEATKVRKVA